MGKNRNYDALHVGIPDWLRSSLQEWAVVRLQSTSTFGPAVRVDKLREIERVCRVELDWPEHRAAVDSLLRIMDSDPDKFWEIVDLLLHRESVYGSDAAVELEGYLLQAGSTWRVVRDDDAYALEHRVPEAVSAAAEDVISSAGKAGQYLASAWHEAYGRDPSAGKAYDDAVKAVEAAAQPVVTPKDSTATLGKMIAAFRNGKGKWVFALKPTKTEVHDVVLGMMEALWQAQVRHGSADPNATIVVELDEAQAAVHLAVTLVQWFTCGAITPRPSP